MSSISPVPAVAPATFPTWARLGLGLVVSFLGYLVAGELVVSEELRGGITSLTLLLATAGIVPPTIRDLPLLSPQVRFLLTAVVTAAGYVLSVVALDPTIRGVIVAALALAGSLGIVPPQASTSLRRVA